jgi:DNA integrity scanning protein DisA with diadenylate cyclase activity
VGDLRVYERGSKARYGSSSVIDLSFTISNYGENEITGYLQNLKFQKTDSDSILTDKPALIQTATYLKSVSDRAKKQIMVYTMFDADTNRDGKLDSSDIKSLYLSESGKRFTKVSMDLQELIDWNLIDSKSRLYFGRRH